MRAIALVIMSMMLVFTWAYGADSTFDFAADLQGWASTGSWGSTPTWVNTEGHGALGALRCTDTDNWYGVRKTVTIGAGNPAYNLTAWVKLVSIDNAWGLNLMSYDLDLTTDQDKPFTTGTLNVWQSQSGSGTGKTGGLGYIMICTHYNSPPSPATIDWYLDDVVYDETPFAGVSDWSLYSSEAVKE